MKWWLYSLLIVIMVFLLGYEDTLTSPAQRLLPWVSLTIYTFGIVIISYYLGGIFNSTILSQTSSSIYKVKSHCRLLAVWKLIRQHRKQNSVKLFKYDPLCNDGIAKERDLLIHTILHHYLFPWYSKISSDQVNFPHQSRLVLQHVFDRLRQKIQNIDRIEFGTEVIELFHSHWTEYNEAIHQTKTPTELLINKFKLAHSYIANEDKVMKHYESMLGLLLPELLPSDVKSPFLINFLCGILVKGFLMYYINLLTDPQWLTHIMLQSIGIHTPPSSPRPQQFESIDTLLTNLDNKSSQSCIQTALTGLLHTTALPLIPNASITQLEIVNTPKTGLTSPTTMSALDCMGTTSNIDTTDSTTSNTGTKFEESPMYEEAEDFATTIAKLRSLLEEKETTRSSLDSESSTSSSTTRDTAATTVIGTTTSTLPEGNGKSGLIGMEDDEDDDSVVCPCFLNVSITKTESFGDSSEQFILYCIQYEGVYIDEDYPSKLIQRTTTVKRSFKEFLLLQSQLEESPIWRGFLKGIQCPPQNRFSFNKSKTHLFHAKRKELLQAYLQEISSHPTLSLSPQFHHFMAYGENGFQIFGTFTNQQPFAKFTRTFAGVMNSLRDVLPSFDDDNPKSKKRLPSFLQFGDKIVSEVQSTQPNIESEDSSDVEDVLEDSNDNLFKSTECDYRLASAVTRLLCDILWLPHDRPNETSISAVMSVSGRTLENYCLETLDYLTSEESWIRYLETCIIYIQNETTSQPLNWNTDHLKYYLKQRIPIWLRWMWGKNRLELTIERLIEFFQIQLINHDFFLSLIELFLGKLTEEEVQDKPPV